jgi:hypothetical protein
VARRGLATFERRTGLPVVALLRELGARFEVLVRTRGRALPTVEELLPTLPPDTRLSGFDTPAELARALRHSSAHAFFSTITVDRRLSRAGKAQFTVAAFELGLEGAQRSARRLLALASTPFYRVYGRFLGATPEADDAPESR